MVFAKHAAAKKRLMDNWQKLVEKRGYTALVEGEMAGAQGVLDSWLAENKDGNVYETEPGARGAQRALTRWTVIEAGPRYTLLALELETGRKHQIRAQLAAIARPIAGDYRYGARSDPLGRLCLHADTLGLEHPFTRERFSFESPAPTSFLALARRA